MTSYINTSDRYGNAELATLDDYRELNPEGTFEERDGDGIYEMVNGQWQQVASVDGDTVTVDADSEDFHVMSRDWRFYNNALWADGGAGDDYLIREIEVDEDANDIEITITVGDVEKHDRAVANGLGDAN